MKIIVSAAVRTSIPYGEMKISPPPGFDPRTVQPVANRYTDWATGEGLKADV